MKQLGIGKSIAPLQPVGIRWGQPVYADNPYLSEGFSIEVRDRTTIIASGLEIRDKEKEDVAAVGVVGKVKQVDKEEFVKLYTKNVSLFFELNQTAQKTLIAVFYAVQKQAKDKADIHLTYTRAVGYYNELGVTKIPSKALFSRGMKILLEQGFIALNNAGVGFYWINPNLIFNGDRIRFVQEYQLTKGKERENNKANEASSQEVKPLSSLLEKQN